MISYNIDIINYIELLKIGAFSNRPGRLRSQSKYPTLSKGIAYSVCSIKIIREDSSVAIHYPSILKQSKTTPLPDS